MTVAGFLPARCAATKAVLAGAAGFLSSHAGGHTAEMLALASQLDRDKFRPRCYVIGDTDALGPSKAAAAEDCLVSSVSTCEPVRAASYKQCLVPTKHT